jgi:hypothetical protein
MDLDKIMQEEGLQKQNQAKKLFMNSPFQQPLVITEDYLDTTIKGV